MNWNILIDLSRSSRCLVAYSNDAVLTNLVDTKFAIVSNYTDIDGVVVSACGEYNISIDCASESKVFRNTSDLIS